MEADLDRLGGRQEGLLTTCQLHAAGWTEKRIRCAIDAGVLSPYPHRSGVYRVRGAPVTRRQAWMAAVLASRTEAVIGGLTAAEAWAFRWLPTNDRLDLLTDSPVQPRGPGIAGHRTLWLPDSDRTRLHFVPITTPERTFIDVCGKFLKDRIDEAGEDLLRRKVMQLPKLVRSFEQTPVSGRRKTVPMRAFLAEHLPGFDPGGSDEELDVMRVLRRADFTPLPKQQHRVKVEGKTYILDYAWPEVMQAMEYLGATIHGVPSAVHYDSDRTRALKRAGWSIWPITKKTSPNEILAIARSVHGL